MNQKIQANLQPNNVKQIIAAIGRATATAVTVCCASFGVVLPAQAQVFGGDFTTTFFTDFGGEITFSFSGLDTNLDNVITSSELSGDLVVDWLGDVRIYDPTAVVYYDFRASYDDPNFLVVDFFDRGKDDEGLWLEDRSEGFLLTDYRGERYGVSYFFTESVGGNQTGEGSGEVASTPEPSLILGFITLGGVMLGSRKKEKA